MSQFAPLTLPSTIPAIQISSLHRSGPVEFLLQLSHRAGAVAMMLTVAVWGMLYESQDFHWVLAGAFAASNVGLCAALAARTLDRRGALGARREAVGAAVFNGVLLAMALQLMLISRLDVLRAAGSAFFTPQ
jgi:hypothetical protein